MRGSGLKATQENQKWLAWTTSSRAFLVESAQRVQPIFERAASTSESITVLRLDSVAVAFASAASRAM